MVENGLHYIFDIQSPSILACLLVCLSACLHSVTKDGLSYSHSLSGQKTHIYIIYMDTLVFYLEKTANAPNAH